MFVQDNESFEAVVARIHAMWDALVDLDPADPTLTVDQRMAAGDCARVMADLDVFGRLPTGWSRRQLLERAREFLPFEFEKYPRRDRVLLESDHLEMVRVAGEYDLALEMIGDACAEFVDLPEYLIEFRAYEANLFQILGRYEEALEAVLEARRLHEKLPAERSAPIYAEIAYRVAEGLILASLGLPDQAQELLSECQEMLTLPGAEAGRGMVEGLAIEVALARDDFEWVVDTLERRVAERGPGLPKEEVESIELQIATARAQGAILGGEVERMQASRAELTQLLGDGTLAKASDMDGPLALAELEFALGDAGQARERLMRLESDLGQLLPESARLPRLSVFELQGRVELATTDSRASLGPILEKLEEGYRDMLSAWSTAPRRKGGVGFLLFDSRRSYLATLIRVRVAVEPGSAGSEKALSYLLEAESMSTLASRMAGQPTSAHDLRHTLVPRDGCLLAYVAAPHTSVIFALREGDIRVFETQSLHALRRLVARWRAALGDDRDGDTAWLAESDLLAGLLPGALAQEARGWSSLVVSGTESIGSIAFECLRPSGDDIAPLGLTYPISYLPSLSVGVALLSVDSATGTASRGPPVALALGGSTPIPRAGKSLPALPWRAEDIRGLQSSWREDFVRTEDQPLEAKALMLNAGADGVELLVVVAHGASDGMRERGWGLAFGTGAEVFPEDFDDRRAPPIVLLAVCEAGRGALRAGDEGISHFGGALLAAGSRTVIVSREDLSFEATVALVSAFQRELASGAAPGDAMYAARQQVASHPRWQDPRYFGLLHVYGASHDLPPQALTDGAAEDATRWWTQLVGILGILAAIGLLIRRSRRQSGTQI